MAPNAMLTRFIVFIGVLLPAFALSAGNASMGPLAPFLQPGTGTAWNIQQAADGGVVLENAAARGDLTYYFVNSQPGEQGQREVSVDVELLRSGANSLAGLLYGYTENPKHYYLFALQGNNVVSLFERTESGFQQRQSQQIGGLPAGRARLSIREQGKSITLLVNGRELSSIGNESIGQGAVGIAAADVGSYRFGNFQVSVVGKKQSIAPSNEPGSASRIASARSNQANTRVIDEIDPAKNMVALRMTIPADWQTPSTPTKVDGLAVKYQSSSGVKVLAGQVRMSFIGSGDPMFDQIARQAGHIVEEYQPLDQLGYRLLLPGAQRNGAKLIKQYKVPDLLRFHRQESRDSPWYQVRFDTYGSDWDMGNGIHSANLAVQILYIPTPRTLNETLNGRATAPNLIMFQTILAPAAIFEQARDAYIAAIANIEINAVWLAADERDHHARMARGEAAGRDAAQASLNAQNARFHASSAANQQIGKTYSDILDISHSGYMRRSGEQQAGHQSVVRGIHERAIISSENGGPQFSVQAGSKYYWGNPATGEYVGTDNSLFDPRTNNQLPGQWERFGVRP